MKKTIQRLTLLCLALTMILSLAACANGDSMPGPEQRMEAILSNKITEEEAKKKGWFDDEMMKWLDENAAPAAGGDENAMTPPIPAKLPVLDKYVYEYMGLSYVLPKEMRDMLKSGIIWTHNENQMNGETDFDYSIMFFNLASKENPGMDFPSHKKYEEWFKSTKRLGVIGVFRSDFLKGASIDKLTGCDENTEIGKSADGKYVFYLSTNTTVDAEIAKLLKDAEIAVSDPAKIPSREIDPYFGMMSVARNAVSDLGNFKAQNVDGKEVGNESFADYDLTMVNLWTTTCGYCIEEMPHLEEIRSEMQKGGIKFNIVGMCLDVNVDGTIDGKKLDKVKEIIKKTGVTYDTLFPDDVLWNGRLKGVNAFPETFFVDKNGKIVGETVVGANDKAKWQEIINKELANLKK